LPNTSAATPAAITREHRVVWTEIEGIPVATLIGGKLSTCLTLAKQLSREVASRLPSLSKEPPGSGEPACELLNFPTSGADRENYVARLSQELARDIESVRLTVQLLGEEAESVLRSDGGASCNVIGTDMPVAVARHAVLHEWVTTLSDLVERRLMLVYNPRLALDTLRHLAKIMVECGRINSADVDDEIDRARERLNRYYGKTVEG
jgi:glycerol-3-phosphate dehydrogenase